MHRTIEQFFALSPVFLHNATNGCGFMVFDREKKRASGIMLSIVHSSQQVVQYVRDRDKKINLLACFFVKTMILMPMIQ